MYFINLSTAYVAMDRNDPLLGVMPKTVLVTRDNTVSPLTMTSPQLIAQANKVRSGHIRSQSQDLVSGSVPDSERVLLLEMQKDLEDRKIATPGDAATIDPILADIKTWQTWVTQVVQDFFDTLDIVRARATLLDSYEPASIDIATLTAARPADNIEQVCRDYFTYITA